VSVDSTGEAGRSRNADGTLPASNFLRLVPGSDLIDVATGIGIPFKGTAPDLGAFEFVTRTTGSSLLRLSPALLDFGTVLVNQSRTLPVLITNNWTDTLKGLIVASPNTLFKASGTRFDLVPGASFTDSIRATAPATASQIADVVLISISTPKETDTISVKLKASPTSSDTDLNMVPETFVLDHNFPNPFNPSTTISFALPKVSSVLLEVYSILGARIRTLVNNQVLPAAFHRVVWDGTDEKGLAVSSGVYIYRMSTGTFSASRTMMLIH
jgi:hypothetical protein